MSSSASTTSRWRRSSSLAGATVAPEAHAHDDHLHVTGVRITIAEELEEGFFAAIPEILADAYGDEDDEDDELGGDVSLN